MSFSGVATTLASWWRQNYTLYVKLLVKYWNAERKIFAHDANREYIFIFYILLCLFNLCLLYFSLNFFSATIYYGEIKLYIYIYIYLSLCVDSWIWLNGNTLRIIVPYFFSVRQLFWRRSWRRKYPPVCLSVCVCLSVQNNWKILIRNRRNVVGICVIMPRKVIKFWSHLTLTAKISGNAQGLRSEDTGQLYYYPNVTTLRSGLCYRKSVCLSICL